MNSICEVELDALVLSEPVVKMSYGIEQLKEILVRYKRLSGKTDNFLVYFSDGLDVDISKDTYIKIKGELRSTIIKDDIGIFPKVYIMAKEIIVLEKEPSPYENRVNIKDGILTDSPRIRKSYDDKNIDIAEVAIKIPRHSKKMSKIMCISWNNNARLISKYQVDDIMNAEGRLQSHETKHGNLLVQVALSAVQIEEHE